LGSQEPAGIRSGASRRFEQNNQKIVNFLLLNQTFYPDVASSGQHLADLAVGLVARGHTVTVITSRRAYDEPQTVFGKEEIWRGVHILRVGSTGFGKNARWRRALDFASFIALICLKVPLLHRHDVVVALTSPPLVSLVGVWLARLHKSRFVYWVMDLNPDEAIAGRWLRANSILTRFLESISRLSLRKAQRIIVLDRFMFERIVAKGIPAPRISVLPPWSHDPEIRFDPAGRESFRLKHGLKGKFVVMYSGNHSPCHPLDTILAATARLLCHPDIIFCFIGGGTEFRKIQRMVDLSTTHISSQREHHSEQKILCLPYQPLSGLSASLSAADLHLVVMGNDFVGLVHPCKIYNLLRIGSPVVYIGPKPSPLFDILSGENRADSACLAHGDVDGLMRVIEARRQLGIQPRAMHPVFPLETFSKATILPQLIARLEAEGECSTRRANPRVGWRRRFLSMGTIIRP
jgi:glycosyltransferase involved in cell wall biosynthesis